MKYREIQKLERINPKTLSEILSRAREAIENGELIITENEVIVNPTKAASINPQSTTLNAKGTSGIPVRNQAYSMFAQGKSLLEVANELNIGAEEVQGFHNEYLILIGKATLASALGSAKKNEILAFVRLCSEMIRRHMDSLTFLDQLEKVSRMDDIDAKILEKTEELANVRKQVVSDTLRLASIRTEIRTADESLDKKNKNVTALTEQEQTLTGKVNDLTKITESLGNSETMERTLRIVRAESLGIFYSSLSQTRVALELGTLIGLTQTDTMFKLMLANGVNQEHMENYIVPMLLEKTKNVFDQQINAIAEEAIRRAALQA
jgi:hypothetical protein